MELTTEKIADMTGNDKLTNLSAKDIIGYKLDGVTEKVVEINNYTDGSTKAIVGAVTATDKTENVSVGTGGAAGALGTEAPVALVIDDDDTTILYVDRAGKTGQKDGSVEKASPYDYNAETFAASGVAGIYQLTNSDNTNSYYYSNVAYLYTDDTNGKHVLDLIVVDVTGDFLDQMA